MLVGAKVCDLTEDLWFVCGLYVRNLTFFLNLVADLGRPIPNDHEIMQIL